MENLDRIFNKIDKIDERLSNIDTTLAKQSTSLDEHIRRTNILEEEIRPIKKHIYLVEAVFKIIGVTSLLVSIFVGLSRFIK